MARYPLTKAVGRGDQTTRRVRVRVLALLEKARWDRGARYLGDQTAQRDQVRVLAWLEKARWDRVLDWWREEGGGRVGGGGWGGGGWPPRILDTRCVQSTTHFRIQYLGGGRGLYSPQTRSSDRDNFYKLLGKIKFKFLRNLKYHVEFEERVDSGKKTRRGRGLALDHLLNPSILWFSNSFAFDWVNVNSDYPVTESMQTLVIVWLSQCVVILGLNQCKQK